MFDLGLDDLLKQIKTKQPPPTNSNPSTNSQPKKEKGNIITPASKINIPPKVEITEEITIIKKSLDNLEVLPPIVLKSEDVAPIKTEDEKFDFFFFKDMTFLFIPFGMTLTKKRVEILTNNIKKRGGKVMNIEDFGWDTTYQDEIFIVVAQDLTKESLFKLFPKINDNIIQDFAFIDCEWITNCLKENKIVDPLEYYIKWNKEDNPSDIMEYTQSEESKPPKEDKSAESNESGWRRNYKRWRNRESPELTAYIEKEELESSFLELEKSMLLKGRGGPKLIKDHKTIMETCKYLYDYLDGCEDLDLKKEEDSDLSYDLGEYKSEVKGEVDIMAFMKENEEEIEFLGKKDHNRQSSFEWTGTLLDGVEGIDDMSDFKNFRVYNPMNKSRAKYWDSKKETFVCQTGAKVNHNPHITDELEKLLKVYTNEKDAGRVFAYRKAISIVKATPYRIQSVNDVKNIKGIGIKIREKITEIITTGKLRKAEMLTKDEKQRTIELFTKVWGIGVQTATKLYLKGFRTIDDLRKNEHLLNDNQKIGLKYFEDLSKRMNREEVTEIVNIVKDKIEELADQKGVFEAICCGSYRRGKPTCGDIDILITRKDGKPFAGFLSKLVLSLEGRLLTDHLAWPKPSEHGSETYMGICRNGGGLHRRIDIKIYPREQFGYAVLYFTGSDYFNRSMRLFANKKGLSLSDHGLVPAIRKKGEKLWSGQNIPCYTEEEVFKVLGLQYRAPNEREV